MVTVSRPQEPESEKLISIDELAAFMGVHKVTVKRHCAEGKIPPCIMVGHSQKWRESDIRNHFKLNGSILPNNKE